MPYIVIALIAALLLTAAGFWIALHTGGEFDYGVLDAKRKNFALYDAEDKQFGGAAEVIAAAEIPARVADAFIAVEDKRFYSHGGVDYVRLAGAAVNNLRGKRLQGGSTITQQLIKNTVVGGEKTFSRKFKEAQMAIRAEKQFSKEEILEKYLNALYFGSGQYGIVNAASRYFGKSPDELTVAQAALLAGIVKSPTKYNPVLHPDNAKTRRDLVLRLMKEQGKISTQDYENAVFEEIIINSSLNENNFARNYYQNALTEAAGILGIDADELPYGGYKIYTYMDDSAQRALEKIVKDGVFYNRNDNGLFPTGAGIVTDVGGGIVAFEANSDIDVFSLRRQPGSVIKPLACYAPALDAGLIAPVSPVLDEKTDFGGYAPENYRDTYFGRTNVATAVAHSLNVPAVKLLQELTVERACRYLRDMDFSLHDNDRRLPLALGGMTYGTTLIELAGGYATLANGGQYRRCGFVRMIADADGNVVYAREHLPARRVFGAAPAYLMSTMLEDCVRTGTADKLSTLPYAVAAKTGTVSCADKAYNNDAYIAGYTSRNAFVFWQGNENGEAGRMGADVTGGGLPALMARTFCERYYADDAPADFSRPATAVMQRLDKYALEHEDKLILATEFAPESATVEALLDGERLPQEIDRTFDCLQVEEFSAAEVETGVWVRFRANPRLEYEIYRRSVLSGEELIAVVSLADGMQEVLCPPPGGMFSTRYIVLPCYRDDAETIIGLPAKYESGADLSNLFPSGRS